MITLDLDLSFLSKYFELTSQKLSLYSGKPLTEIVDAEKKAGNENAGDFEKVLNDPKKLAELLLLQDPINRFLIIRNLTEDDLMGLLEFLPSQDLAWGMQYFTLDKMMELMAQIPKEELIPLVLSKFPIEQIVALMKPEEMNEFMQNSKIERKDYMNFFETLEPEMFKALMSQVFGAEVQNENKKATLERLETMNDDEFQKTMLNFEDSGKMLIIWGLLESKQELMTELTGETLVRPFGLIEKGDIIKCLDDLKPEFLIPMIKELPKDVIQVVATQINPEIFADVLIKEFPDVLKEITF